MPTLDRGFLPDDLGAYVVPWVEAAADGWPLLEESAISGWSSPTSASGILPPLSATSRSYNSRNVREGFTTTGLAAITQSFR